MVSVLMKDNKDINSYFTTKHSYWRGKYKRIFSVGTKGITTYNPATLEITNHWPYEEFVGILPSDKSSNEFCITMKKSAKKTDTMRFSTDHRSDLLTEALKHYKLFAEKNLSTKLFKAYKHHWSDKKLPVSLEVNPGSLNQIDESTGKSICSYYYKDIEGLALVGDYVNGVSIIYGGFGRQHLFKVENRDELIRAIQEAAIHHIGINIKLHKDSISFDHFQMQKFGKYCNDESLTSCSEFSVMKFSRRRNDAITRNLCLSETCIIERDPLTYQVVTLRPLCDIFSIIRSANDPQELGIEYLNGEIRKYTSTDRDALLATLMDGVRSSGNKDVHIKMNPTNRGHRLGPFTVPVDEEVESQYLKFLQNPPNGMTQSEALSRFNSNISYNGLLHAVTAETLFAEKKEKLIIGALSSLLDDGKEVKTMQLDELEAQLQALRRLVASKAGFSAFTTLPHMREKVGLKVVKSLKRNDLGVSHAAVDMLCSLIQPMHENCDLRQEQLNKSSVLSSKKFLENLLDMFTGHINRGSGALVISAMLDFLTYSLCAPYSETTDGACFDTLLEMVACNGRSIFKLFQHTSFAIIKGAGLVMKAIIEEGDADVAVRMQNLSLAEGALPQHLITACYTDSNKNHLLTGRQLSRHLISLWVTGHETSLGLLKRIMPSGLLMFLDSKDDVPAEEIDRTPVRDNLKLAQEQEDKRKKNVHWKQIEKRIEDLFMHWKSRIGLESDQEQQQQEKVLILRKRRQRIKPLANWKLFYYQFCRDHAKPNLIWNSNTRDELKRALEEELRLFKGNRDLLGNIIISWNHQEFEVHYKSLDDEIKIGDYYLRILLEEGEKDSNNAIKQSNEFFSNLYHRFLLSSKVSMKCMCLQAMSIVYGRCHEEIGPFNDTKSIVAMLERCTDKLERDRLIMFISKLLLNKSNIKDVIDSNGIKTLVDLLTLAHLHTSRAVVPTQTTISIEATDSKWESAKEWCYGSTQQEKFESYSFEEMEELWKTGVITSTTRCWAPGVDGWRPPHMIPQLKWVLMATGQPLLNESQLAILILDMLIKIVECYPSRDVDNAVVRPLPKIKRILSNPSYLPHIVQLLLTFDPILVEKVSILLYQVMDENPNMPIVYQSGVFYFILMYNGSNVLPVARFLKATHMRQAFREDLGSDIMNKSILGHLLPEAMVCYLENYEPEKFAEIFLGEFDNPEAIWNREMRLLMMSKIASHVADLKPRLQSNTRALYSYCTIPVIVYPQLENELFCSSYYLRHLCDTLKFPDWPIKEPVRLLKDILECWRVELEQKPPTMSTDEAFESLQLDKDTLDMDGTKIRKAYHKMSQKYHPDKNKDGGEIFVKAKMAYEFLCSRSKLFEGPNPKNIVLILKAQTILFSRFKTILEPYKYAGYPTLIKTIKLESTDKGLFSKSDPLLTSAAELCYHTMNCSALNAEELRRENGIQVLHEAFSRCVGVLGISSKSDDLCVQVCSHIVQCLGVSSQFEACRNQISEMPEIAKEISRILYYRNVPRLCQHAAECVSQMSIDALLQTQLYEAGVLWHLLLFLFDYDFTLEEGGVKKSDLSNEQENQNVLAKMAIRSCARLGGYLTSKDDDIPENPPVKKSLSSLLTPYLANKLSEDKPSELLKLMTSNSENPLLIWNNETRAELIEYLTNQQQQMIRTSTCDEDYGSNFKFTSLSKELIVGDVFVRIYNQQPTFVLDNAKGFTIELLDYLGSQAQYLYSLMTLQHQQSNTTNSSAERISNVGSCLEALHNVILNNPGVEIQCIGHFKLLFSLLRVEGCFRVQQKALEVISSVTGRQECIIDISASGVMAYLLLTISSLPQINQLTLQVMYPLCSHTKLLKEITNKGGLLYMLDLFCNSTNHTVREQCAELFGRMLADKLLGTPVRIVMLKFIPSLILDAMRDSPESSIHLFEGTHENPELIWNDDSRNYVSSTIKEMRENHYNLQKDDPSVNWAYDKEMECLYSGGKGEVVVGDVYLRLFIANPGWLVRKPKDFLVALFDKWSQLVSNPQFDGEALEMVTAALVSFLNLQPALLDHVPELGLIPKLFKSMTSKNNAIPKSALLIVQQLANNEMCIRAIGKTNSIGPMKEAMEVRKDMIGTGCESLMKMFNTNDESLVEQALSTHIIGFLLNLLEKDGLEFVENISSVKAQIVNALKAMQLNAKYGDQINELLEKSPVWKDYKNQKHDLFLSDRPIAGYLTGSGVAGYLTCSTPISKLPPPML